METTHITIYDCLTGETITRVLTDNELAQREKSIFADKLEAEAKAKAEDARDRKRQEVLDRLGITAEELKTILS